jgi:hypothetical protein
VLAIRKKSPSHAETVVCDLPLLGEKRSEALVLLVRSPIERGYLLSVRFTLCGSTIRYRKLIISA